jgi:CheY-like chemotaxis protein
MYNILIVDDDPPFAESLKTLLQKTGSFTAKICTHSTSAVQIAKAMLPELDLVLLDIVMPKADGTEVASLIRGDSELKNIAIVFLTGSPKEVVTHADLPTGVGKIGGEDFILKGTKKEQLVHQLEKSIQENRARGAIRNAARQP